MVIALDMEKIKSFFLGSDVNIEDSDDNSLIVAFNLPFRYAEGIKKETKVKFNSKEISLFNKMDFSSVEKVLNDGFKNKNYIEIPVRIQGDSAITDKLLEKKSIKIKKSNPRGNLPRAELGKPSNQIIYHWLLLPQFRRRLLFRFQLNQRRVGTSPAPISFTSIKQGIRNIYTLKLALSQNLVMERKR